MPKYADIRVEEYIKNALRSDSRIDLSEIEVHVEEGVVYLSGTVDSAAERRAAREDLLAAPEVKQIVDQLKLRNYVERTDDELCQSVMKALNRDIDIDERRISLEASNGTITMRGLVSSFAQKIEAENVAWWTPGVTDVINRLEVDARLEPDEDDY